ncbi:MAG: PhnD/SsuA/transferrin family substrate-binding protein [Acidimicrobiales bacterium]
MTTRPLKLGGVPEHFNLPWHLALESGDLDDVQAVWEDQSGGTGQMLSKLASGDLDVASILTEGTVSAIDKGLPVTIVQVYVSTPLQWGIFVPGRSRYQEVSELDGARIAISRFNSGSHLMAYILAEPLGWRITDDQFIVIGNLEGAVESFAGGHSDLFLWERHMTAPLVESGHFRQLDTMESPWPSFVIAVRDEILAARTTEVGRVVDAVVARAAGLKDMPDAVDLVAERYGLRPHTVKSWLALTTFAERSAMDPAIGHKVLETLARAGFS